MDEDMKEDKKPEQQDEIEAQRGVENREEEQEEEYMEVAKPNKVVQFDDLEAERMIQLIKKKEQDRKQALERIQKNALKKKKSEAVNDRKSKTPLQIKRQKINDKIAPLMKKFKSLNLPNYSDSECSKFRYQQKQKLFKYLLYGIEELRELDPSNFTQEQKNILTYSQNEIYMHAKSVVTQVDIDFLYVLNNGNKQTVGKRYQEHWKNLTHNIEDQDNLPMRKKIVSKAWGAKQIATCNETDFYSEKRKQYIREQNDRIMSQAAKVESNKSFMVQQQAVIEYNSDYRTNKRSNESQSRKKQEYRYLQTSTMALLKDLISTQKVQRMKNLLQEGLRPEISDRLVANLEKVLENKNQ